MDHKWLGLFALVGIDWPTVHHQGLKDAAYIIPDVVGHNATKKVRVRQPYFEKSTEPFDLLNILPRSGVRLLKSVKPFIRKDVTSFRCQVLG